MDIVLDDDAASDPVKDKTNNVVSMVGALIGGIDGLDPLQKGLVDQCVSNLYTRYRNQGGGVTQPRCRTCTTSSRTAATTRAGTSPTRSTRTSPAP